MNKGLLSAEHILKSMNIIGIVSREYCPVVKDFGSRQVGSNHGSPSYELCDLTVT